MFETKILSKCLIFKIPFHREIGRNVIQKNYTRTLEIWNAKYEIFGSRVRNLRFSRLATLWIRTNK